MLSIKSLVAAVALGTALIAAPAAVSAKVTHKHTTTTFTHKKPSKLHKHVKHTHKPLVSKHAKTTKLAKSTKHAAHKSTKLTAHSKTSSHKLSAGWKHHRSV
ncbi:MAG: hypothetical protein ACTHN5_13640 [Phycisphaerae bacterium]